MRRIFKETMIVALFADTYLPNKNGVATSVAQLKSELELLGHTVYVYTVKMPGYKEEEENVYRSPAIEMHIIGADEGRLGIANVFQMMRRLKKDRVELIHTHSEFFLGLAGRFLARRLDIPHVHTVHTMWKDYRHYLLGGSVFSKKRIAKLFKTFLRGCTAVVAPSPKAAAYIHELDIRSYLVNNGVDRALFSQKATPEQIEALSKSLKLQKEDIPVLFVGRLAQEKRALQLVSTLVKAMRQEKNLLGLVVGEGNDLPELQKIAAEAGLEGRFIFTGAIPHSEISSYYALSKIYCTLSLSEVQPMTVIEALISALPLVARQDLAYSGMVRPNENGFLADTDEEAAQKLVLLAKDKALRKRYGAKSKELSEHYSSRRQAQEMAQLYAKVIAAGRPRVNKHKTLVFND